MMPFMPATPGLGELLGAQKDLQASAETLNYGNAKSRLLGQGSARASKVVLPDAISRFSETDPVLTTARSLAKFPVDPAGDGTIAAAIRVHASRSPGLGAALADFERFQEADGSGKVGTGRSLEQWRKLTEAPASMTDEDLEEVIGNVRQFGDATDSVEDWGKVAGVDFRPSGAAVVVSAPGLTDDVDVRASIYEAAVSSVPAIDRHGATTGVVALPDGSVLPFAPEGAPAARRLRNRFPTATDSQGVSVWVPGAPHAVADMKTQRLLATTDAKTHIEAYDALHVKRKIGEHPALNAGDFITFEGERITGYPTKDLGGVEVEGFDDSEEGIERTARRVRKLAYKVSPEEAGDIGKIANIIESLGGENVAIYGCRETIPGWEPASELLFTDGAQTMVVRTKTADSKASNVATVFVRPKEHAKLSDAFEVGPLTPKQVPGGFVLNGAVRLHAESPDLSKIRLLRVDTTSLIPTPTSLDDGEADPQTAKRTASGWVLVPDPEDLLPSVKAADAMRRAGLKGEIRLELPSGSLLA